MVGCSPCLTSQPFRGLYDNRPQYLKMSDNPFRLTENQRIAFAIVRGLLFLFLVGWLCLALDIPSRVACPATLLFGLLISEFLDVLTALR